MLKLQFKDLQRPPFWVVERLYKIGSAAHNHLVLDQEGIAPVHAHLEVSDDKTFLKDNGSETGSFVNGQKVTDAEIQPGDRIRLGPVEIEVLASSEEPDSNQALGRDLPPKTESDPWRLVATGSWLSGQTYIIPQDGCSIIGRSKQCDIVIPGTHLSRRHAELRPQGGSLHIKDLGSVNGTYLNDKPITQSLAHGGDQLRLDVYSFRIVSPEGDRSRTRVRQRPTKHSTPEPTARAPKASALPPKRWKTRPTSPGNRQEPTYKEKAQESWLWLVVGAVVLLLIASFFWI